MPRRLVVSSLLKRLVLTGILLAPGTPAVLSQQVAATAMVQPVSAPPTATPPRTIGAPPDDTLQFQALPTPSGAERPYPLNHSFDATGSDLGALTTNAGFETAPTTPGTPPTNADLAAAASDVGTPPTNHDFASGDFTGWTTAGSPLPTIDADATRGSWAKLSTSGATITTDAFMVDADAQAFVFDLGYLTTSSLLYVSALTGAGYSTSTQLESFYCPSTCTTGWQSISLNAAPYVGQSIKLKFARSAGQLGVDNVRTQQLLPGYGTSGSVTRATEAGGNAYARLAASGKLTSAAFTIDSTAQFASVQLQGYSGSSIQYYVKVLSDPGFSTVTQVASGSLSVTGSWQTIRFNVAGWRGAAIKLRVEQFTGTFGVDNVGLQTLDFPGWEVTGTANRLDDGAGNHYISSGGLLTSDAVVLPGDAQQFSLRYRAETASAPFFVELLHDATFSTVESLGYVGATDMVNWTTVTYNVNPYAGETVKLRIRQSLGRGQYDDVGLGALVAPGWTLTPDSAAIAGGSDSHGSYMSPLAPLGTIFLASSPLATGIIDRAGTTDYRFYAISYEIGFSTSSLFQVFWVNAAGSSWTVLQDGASSPTGYRTRYFYLTDALGATGHFVIKAVGGGKVYSLADNIARQQVNEPFARKVGLSIDTSTGSFGYREQDLAVQGAMPLVLSRSYVGQSDQYGTLGYRWSHSYDTRLVVDANGDAGVLFGAGGEEFFDWNSAFATFTAADARTHDTLVKNGDGSYTFTTKSNLAYHFTSAGVLDTISDLNGKSITLAYDGSGRLATATDPASQSLTFAYDANGRLATVTDPVNAVVTYGYDANGDLTTVTDPENGVTTYSYDQHRLTSVVDENNKTLFTNTYDDWHRVTSQSDALNKTITLSYDTPGKGATRVTDPENQSATYYFDAQQRTTDQVDPLSNVISYLFDGNGNLQKVIDPANNQWQFAYDATGADLTGATDPLSNPVTITYNAQHLPTTVQDARGNVTTYSYDTHGNVLTKTDPYNKVWTYTYDANGYLASVTNPLNEVESYTNDAQGRPLTRTNALGHTTHYTYNDRGQLTTVQDPLLGTVSYTYSVIGRVNSQTDQLGHTKSWTYNYFGDVTSETDETNHTTFYGYDDKGNLTTVIDPANKTWTYSYDGNGNRLTETDPLGKTTTYGYDAAGRRISQTDPLNHTMTYSYDAAGRLLSETDPVGRVTSYSYDAAGRMTSRTLPNTGIYTYTYDADGNRLTVTDPLNHTTSYGYDKLSRRASVTDALNNTTVYSYDDAGRLSQIQRPLNHTTTYTYDAAGRLTAVADPLNHTRTFGYDNADRRTSVTDALNQTTTYSYDAAGRLTGITNPLNQTTSYGYDHAGRRTWWTNPLSQTTTYAYNSRGLLASVTDPLSRVTTYAYDDAGRQITMTNPRNATTTYGYDASGQLTSITDALNGTLTFGYDAAGQRTAVTNPRGKTTTYTFDSLGQVLTETDPLGQVSSSTFDLLGRATSRVDARTISTSYGYDAAGRLTSITYPGGTTTYSYDALGRRTSMVDPTGTTSRTYDAASRVTSVVSPQGTVNYDYDAVGQRVAMTLPGNRTVSYSYDPAGRLSGLTDWQNRTTSYGYDNAGRRTSETRPNGVTSTYSYDNADQLTSISHANASGTLESFAYSIDGAGNRIAVTSIAGTEAYTFDLLNRITQVTYPNGDSVSYTYDGNGNRLTKTINGVTTNYTYDDADQLTSAGSTNYTYDANGNLTTAGNDSFTWDWNNRLASATVNGTTVTYAYDGTDTRVAKTVGGTQTDYLWDRESELATLVDDGTNAYLHASAPSVAIDAAGTPSYLLGDALGSIRGMTDASGALVSSADYDVFGSIRSQTGASSGFGFTGEQFDSETGLTYLRARALDPQLGRFLSRDRVQPNAPGTQGFNRYAYVANNPTTWTDPTGHFVLGGAAAGAAGGGIIWTLLPYFAVIGLLIALDYYITGCTITCPALETMANLLVAVFVIVACALEIGGPCYQAIGLEGSGSGAISGSREKAAEKTKRATETECKAAAEEVFVSSIPLPANKKWEIEHEKHGPRQPDPNRSYFTQQAWDNIDMLIEQAFVQGTVMTNPSTEPGDAPCIAYLKSDLALPPMTSKTIGWSSSGKIPFEWIAVPFDLDGRIRTAHPDRGL